MTKKEGENGENVNVHPEPPKDPHAAYGTGDEGRAEEKFALGVIETVNAARELRERNSLVTNGIPYSQAYLYNLQKGINYSPPRNPKDDREVSMGIVHEKIIAFTSIFIKYLFRRQIKAYDRNTGSLLDNLGEVYDLGIEFSHKAEQFGKKVVLIYWEVFTQGNAFVLEDWDVRNITKPKAVGEIDGKEVEITPENMDYTYEFLEGLKFSDGDQCQERRAVSRILDGRMVIFDNPEIEEVQDQPGITIEEEIPRADAEQLYGSLKRWEHVPDEKVDIDALTPEKTSLFSTSRLTDPKKSVIVHRRFDRFNNRFNIFLNGLMMLPSKTPMSLFYPRLNYPLSNIPAERLKGSIYSRSIPAKTKFNADYLDFVFKHLALKFEQGTIPAILAKGKYTLTRDIFRAGQVTHGVSTSDYEKADPENKGVTAQEANFASMIKDIVEAQTLNATATGEFSPDATATEIAITDQNQRDKLSGLLDGLAGGFMDLAYRRAETLETKYTKKVTETIVDGKSRAVYHDFHVNIGGTNHKVIFLDAIGDPTYNHEEDQYQMFQESFNSKKQGKPEETYKVDPVSFRDGLPFLDIVIIPERVKEVGVKMTEMWNEFTMLINTFGGNVNMDTLKKIYLETRGRPAEVFNSADMMKLQQLQAQQEQADAAAPKNGNSKTGGGAPGVSNNRPSKGARQRPTLV